MCTLLSSAHAPVSCKSTQVLQRGADAVSHPESQRSRSQINTGSQVVFCSVPRSMCVGAGAVPAGFAATSVASGMVRGSCDGTHESQGLGHRASHRASMS